MKRSGSCQCGTVRYECDRDAEDIYVCHCRNCQKQSASAYGISFVVRADSFRITAGRPEYFRWTSDAGNPRKGGFCGRCGTRLWHQRDLDGIETLNVRGGSLDEPVDLGDAIHIWLRSKLPGVPIPEGARRFPAEPDVG